MVPTWLWSEFVAGPSVTFGPELSSVRLWFSIRICLRSESGFQSGVSFGPNLFFVHFCFWSVLIGGLYLVFTPDLCLVWIWFSVRICLWYEFVAVPNLVFGPICLSSESGLRPSLSWVIFFLWSQFHFGPNFLLVSTCLWSEFVAGPSVFSGPDLSSVLLWFSIRIVLRSESGFRAGVSFGPNLSLVRFCFWSELVGGLYLVFCTSLSMIWICLFPIMSLVQIRFSLRICVWSESCFRAEFFFCALLFAVRTCRWPLSGFRYDFVFDLNLSFSDYVVSPNPVFTPDLCLVWILFSNRICL